MVFGRRSSVWVSLFLGIGAKAHIFSFARIKLKYLTLLLAYFEYAKKDRASEKKYRIHS